MHRRAQWIASTMAVVGAVTLAACGTTTSNTPANTPATASAVNPKAPETNPAGDIPDNQVYVPYQGDSSAVLFTVKVPEGWAKSGTGDAVTFSDKLNGILIDVHSAATPPTMDSVMTSVLPQIQQQRSNVTGAKMDSVTRSAGTAVLLTYQSDAAPDPVTGKVVNDDVERYAFWKSGTEVVLTLSGPHGADNVDPWRMVTDSFAWTQ